MRREEGRDEQGREEQFWVGESSASVVASDWGGGFLQQFLWIFAFKTQGQLKHFGIWYEVPDMEA